MKPVIAEGGRVVLSGPWYLDMQAPAGYTTYNLKVIGCARMRGGLFYMCKCVSKGKGQRQYENTAKIFVVIPYSQERS
jgi:hypothetical protein